MIMIKLKQFAFNPLQVNTYLLYNEKGQCVIVDPSCIYAEEEKKLQDFIETNGLKPTILINTHCHVDHVAGNQFVFKTWGLKPQIHQAGESILESAPEQAMLMGFPPVTVQKPDKYLKDGKIIQLCKDEIEIRYTPGHADGSICLIMHKEQFLLSGDVLFAGSVGRADLPTGNMELLVNSIKEKLMTLPGEYVVYPGHGPATSIEDERNFNPFL